MGLVLGFYSRNKKESLVVGAAYGFVISFAFLIADYHGAVAVVYRFVPFALLSLIGLAGGILLGFIGFVIKTLFKKRK